MVRKPVRFSGLSLRRTREKQYVHIAIMLWIGSLVISSVIFVLEHAIHSVAAWGPGYVIHVIEGTAYETRIRKEII